MKTMKVILISLLCLYSFSGVADIQSELFLQAMYK